jgi:hypothetical protein
MVMLIVLFVSLAKITIYLYKRIHFEIFIFFSTFFKNHPAKLTKNNNLAACTQEFVCGL